MEYRYEKKAIDKDATERQRQADIRFGVAGRVSDLIFTLVKELPEETRGELYSQLYRLHREAGKVDALMTIGGILTSAAIDHDPGKEHK